MTDDASKNLPPGLHPEVAHRMRSFVGAALLSLDLLDADNAGVRRQAAAIVRRNTQAISDLIDELSQTVRQQDGMHEPAQRLRPGVRVLVVEDEFLLAQTVADILETAGCVVVGPVGTIEDALNLIAESGFDCAVVDANLHGQQSTPVLEAISARALPAAILSGYDRATLPPKLRGLPFLQKPVDEPRLLQIVGSMG